MENEEIFYRMIKDLGILKVDQDGRKGFALNGSKEEIADLATSVLSLQRNMFRLMMAIAVGLSGDGKRDLNIALFCRETMIKMVESEHEDFIHALLDGGFQHYRVDENNQKVDA